ncbi:ATP-binding cassette domain-containing protein [Jatrophihabitans sp.]|uniref:ATP-binding cassette domain-containing protein n=1 Tax=Jatrophihabitans sp. TaxID=1932789 RepID=UPI002F002482
MSTPLDADLAIEVRGLVKRYRGGRGQDDIDAVRGIDLVVRRGEVFGFLGPNGAGKTTTVRMLCTLLPISDGHAKVAGVDVRRDPAEVRRHIGVALQEVGLDPTQTGRELLELQCALYRVADPAGRCAELLALVGLSEAANRTIKTYSGGMKRRLDLATALVHKPQVLFLDEPTTGLDPASRATVWEEVRRINAAGTTIFLTTQYLEEADQLCDRLAIIDDGRLVAAGTPDSLKAELGSDVITVGLRQDEHRPARDALAVLPGMDHVTDAGEGLAVYVRDGAAAVADVVRLLVDAGIRPGTVTLARPSLDDVFLASTGRRIEGGAPEAAA